MSNITHISAISNHSWQRFIYYRNLDGVSYPCSESWRKPKFNTYKVDYYYCASGMEGHTDHEDYGYIDAMNKSDARYISVKNKHPEYDKETREWVISCLSCKEVEGKNE